MNTFIMIWFHWNLNYSSCKQIHYCSESNVLSLLLFIFSYFTARCTLTWRIHFFFPFTIKIKFIVQYHFCNRRNFLSLSPPPPKKIIFSNLLQHWWACSFSFNFGSMQKTMLRLCFKEILFRKYFLVLDMHFLN